MEETIGYEALLSAEEWDQLDLGEWKERKTSLREADALRIGLALNDYEQVSITDIGGSNCFGFWIRFRDERSDTDHEICSGADYWDYIAHYAAGEPWTGRVPRQHTVVVVVVEDGYELTCDACDFSEHLSDVTEADNRKRLHEAFVATLVARFEAA